MSKLLFNDQDNYNIQGEGELGISLILINNTNYFK
jgi:hypothetical protein